MSKQLPMFQELNEVKQDNLSDWIYEVGQDTPMGKFLYLLHCQLPSGFVELLEYRAGSDEDEVAAESLLYLDEWYKELAAFNMARLEAA